MFSFSSYPFCVCIVRCGKDFLKFMAWPLFNAYLKRTSVGKNCNRALPVNVVLNQLHWVISKFTAHAGKLFCLVLSLLVFRKAPKWSHELWTNRNDIPILSLVLKSLKNMLISSSAMSRIFCLCRKYFGERYFFFPFTNFNLYIPTQCGRVSFCYYCILFVGNSFLSLIWNARLHGVFFKLRRLSILRFARFAIRLHCVISPWLSYVHQTWKP